MTRTRFPGFTVTLPPGWEDMTEAFGDPAMPPTVARRDGVGALQFSVATYRRGKLPDPAPQDLMRMVCEFGVRHGWAAPTDSSVSEDALRAAAASFESSEDFVRVWYVSDGRSIMLATYTCNLAAPERITELEACEEIVRSVELD